MLKFVIGGKVVMVKIRFEITKGEEIRYISHLDYARAMERAIRRAQLPMAYSEGFNPHSKMAFASALAVGVTSEAEYMDLELTEEINLQTVISRLQISLPAGVCLKQARYIPASVPALMAVVNLASYEIKVILRENTDVTQISAIVNQFNQTEDVVFIRQSPKGRREINIKQYLAQNIKILDDFDVNDNCLKLSMFIHITPTGSVKPGEIVEQLVDGFHLPICRENFLIKRTGLFVAANSRIVTPMEVM